MTGPSRDGSERLEVAHPIVRKTLRLAVGLRPGGDGGEAGREVLATYRSRNGEDMFALCRTGLLLKQGRGWRYFDNVEIERVRLDTRVKSSTEGRRIIVSLKNGQIVDLAVDGQWGSPSISSPSMPSFGEACTSVTCPSQDRHDITTIQALG